MLKSVEQAIQDAANEIARQLQEIESEQGSERGDTLLSNMEWRQRKSLHWKMSSTWFTDVLTEQALVNIEQLEPEEREIARLKIRERVIRTLNGARFTAAMYGKNVIKETSEYFYVLWQNGLLRTLALAQQLLEPDELVLLDMKMDPPQWEDQ